MVCWSPVSLENSRSKSMRRTRGGWPRSRCSFPTQLRVPPVPNIWGPGAGGPLIHHEQPSGALRSCAPFIAFFAMSGRCHMTVAGGGLTLPRRTGGPELKKRIYQAEGARPLVRRGGATGEAGAIRAACFLSSKVCIKLRAFGAQSFHSRISSSARRRRIWPRSGAES